MHSRLLDPGLGLRAWTIALALAAMLAGCSGEDRGSKKTDMTAVEQAVSAAVFDAPHGLSARSGFEPSLYELMQNEPEAVSRAIGNLIDFEGEIGKLEGGNREAGKRLGRTFELLGTYPSSSGDDLLGEWYQRLSDRRSRAAQPVNEFDRLSYQILDALADRYVSAVARRIQASWDGMGDTERRLSLGYLAKSGKGVGEALDIVRELRSRSSGDTTLFDRALTYMEG